MVSYRELMRQGQSLTVYTHLLVQTYLIIAVVYVVINFGLSQLASRIDRRLQRQRPSVRQRPSSRRGAMQHPVGGPGGAIIPE